MCLKGSSFFFNFQKKIAYIFQLFVYNFSKKKKKTTASQTHFGYINVVSEKCIVLDVQPFEIKNFDLSHPVEQNISESEHFYFMLVFVTTKWV